MSDQLDSFLDNTPEEPEAPVVETTPEPAEEVPPAPAAEPPEVVGLKQAAAAERHKRQQAEAMLAQYQAALAAKEQEERPYLGEEYEQRFQQVEGRLQHELTKQRIDMSEQLVRSLRPDYDEKMATFAQLVAANPAIYQQMAAQANPADFAYTVATQHLTVLEKSDPNYESKLKERLKAEILAEQNGTRQPQTPTLADARGGAGARPAEWSGPMGLNDILK